MTIPAQVWWRAQAAAYIIRPNNHTMAKIRRLRMNPKLHNVWQYGKAATHLSVPYPLPPGTISMHVRRGHLEHPLRIAAAIDLRAGWHVCHVTALLSALPLCLPVCVHTQRLKYHQRC